MDDLDKAVAVKLREVAREIEADFIMMPVGYFDGGAAAKQIVLRHASALDGKPMPNTANPFAR
jgi:hypothetical protein